MHTNIPVFCTHFEKDTPLIILFPWVLKYPTIIPVYMLLRAYSQSHYCNVRHSVWPNSPSFALAPLQICRQVAPIVCNSIPTFYIITSFNPFSLWRCMRSGPQFMPPRTAQRFWMRLRSREHWERVDPERVAVMEGMERQLSGVPQVFMKFVCNDGENRAPPG